MAGTQLVVPGAVEDGTEPGETQNANQPHTSKQSVSSVLQRAWTFASQAGDMGRAPYMDEKVAKVLDGVTVLRRKSIFGNDDSKNKARQVKVEYESGTNFTIFQEEGELHPTYPTIRFLSPIGFWMDRLRLVFSLWTLIYCPLFLSFAPHFDILARHPALVTFDVIGDIVFLLGVLTAFNTTFARVSVGTETLDLREIAMHRLKSPLFWCEFLSIIPFVVMVFSGQIPPPTSGGVYYLIGLKLMRTYWVLALPASHFELWFWSSLQLLKLMIWITASMHVVACMWYSLATAEGTFAQHLEEVSFQDDGFSAHYLLAFKYGNYIITGKPVEAFSQSELSLIGVSSPVGGLFIAWIYGSVTVQLNRMNIQMNKHHEHTASIERTLKGLDIPEDLKHRVKKYHHFLAVHHNVSAYQSLMTGLSVNLFIELRANLFGRLLHEAPFFTDAPPKFIRKLLQVMVEVTFGPGDVVIRCGDIGEQMYFVVKGRLEVLNPTNQTIGRINENQYFGEVALLLSTPRKVSIRSVTYCLLAMISRESFLPLINTNLETKERMLQFITKYKHSDDGDRAGEESEGGGTGSDDDNADDSDEDGIEKAEGVKRSLSETSKESRSSSEGASKESRRSSKESRHSSEGSQPGSASPAVPSSSKASRHSSAGIRSKSSSTAAPKVPQQAPEAVHEKPAVVLKCPSEQPVQPVARRSFFGAMSPMKPLQSIIVASASSSGPERMTLPPISVASASSSGSDGDGEEKAGAFAQAAARHLSCRFALPESFAAGSQHGQSKGVGATAPLPAGRRTIHVLGAKESSELEKGRDLRRLSFMGAPRRSLHVPEAKASSELEKGRALRRLSFMGALAEPDAGRQQVVDTDSTKRLDAMEDNLTKRVNASEQSILLRLKPLEESVAQLVQQQTNMLELLDLGESRLSSRQSSIKYTDESPEEYRVGAEPAELG